MSPGEKELIRLGVKLLADGFETHEPHGVNDAKQCTHSGIGCEWCTLVMAARMVRREQTPPGPRYVAQKSGGLINDNATGGVLSICEAAALALNLHNRE